MLVTIIIEGKPIASFKEDKLSIKVNNLEKELLNSLKDLSQVIGIIDPDSKKIEKETWVYQTLFEIFKQYFDNIPKFEVIIT